MPIHDLHCHLFGLGYLLREASWMLLDSLHGRYPSDPHLTFDIAGAGSEPLTSHQAIQHLLRWLHEVWDAALADEEENYQRLVQAMEDHLDVPEGEGTVVTPLMMDIYYMFAPPLGPDGSVPIFEKGALSVDLESFVEEFDRILGADPLPEFITARRGVLDEIEKQVQGGELKAHQQYRLPRSVHFTLGFAHAYEKHRELSARYGDACRPFLAVDPRREGIVDLLTSGRAVKKQPGWFHGVKLYPRLGCHPRAAAMQTVLRHCAATDIPVTTHTTDLGFPPWPCATADYGDPANFTDAVNEDPRLRINYAHLGFNRPAWADTILEQMGSNRGNNKVYADLSSYTCDAHYETVPWDRLPPDRLLFGTDFDLFYLVERGQITLQEYYQRARDACAAHVPWDAMTRDNPRRFLGRPAGAAETAPPSNPRGPGPFVHTIPGFDGIVYQQLKDNTCGPASVRMLLLHFDIDVSEARIARHCFLLPTGTLQWGVDAAMDHYLRPLKLRSDLRGKTTYKAIKKEIGHNHPVVFIWAVDNDLEPNHEPCLHYSLVIGLDEARQKVTIANPFGYIEEMGLSEWWDRFSLKDQYAPLYSEIAVDLDLLDERTAFIVQRRTPCRLLKRILRFLLGKESPAVARRLRRRLQRGRASH